MLTGPTLVTALLDVGRGQLDGPFARSFEHEDLPLFERLLSAVELPMVVYADPAHHGAVRRARGRRPLRLIPFRPAELRATPHYPAIDAVRSDPAWRSGVPWLRHSPRAALDLYAPYLLAKPTWLIEQARADPFGSGSLFWVDPDICRTTAAAALEGGAPFARLAGDAKGRLLLLAATSSARGSVRGEVFGGSVPAILALAEHYDQAIAEALAGGWLGGPEELLARLATRLPALFSVRGIAPGQPTGEQLRRLTETRRDTLVTAVYDVRPDGPLGGRGRGVGYYLPSLASIAQLGAGMVAYTQPALVDQLTAHLDALDVPAVVIARELEDAPRYDQIQEIRARQRFDEKPWRDRCHVLCHAKLAFLAEQAAADPFGSERFYWIDAGLAYPGLLPRRYLPEYFGPPSSLFAAPVLDGLAGAGDLVMVGLHPPEGARMHDIALDEHLPWIGPGGRRTVDTHVIGGLFGGARRAVRALYADYDPVLATMLAADRLGTEENVLTVLYHRDPARFRLLPFTTWHHEDSDVRRPGPGDVPFYRVLESLAGAASLRYAERPS